MASRALRLGKAVGDRSQPVASIWADTLRPGTPGYDTITGTPGDDTITGTPDNDTLNGEGGDDTLYGVGGNDNLNGGDGHDRLEGGEGGDGLDGGEGNDTLVGGAGGDGLHGGDGNDTLIGGSAGGGLYGGPGDLVDGLYGGAGDDILDGGGGGDLMVGGTGNDTYYVDKILSIGGDRIFPLPPIPGDDILELAGEGFDTVYVGLAAYDRTHWFGVDTYFIGANEIEVLAARYPESGRIMRFGGSNSPNAIYGAANEFTFGDELWGFGGDDVLYGLGGYDQLYGGEDNDVIVGGPGDDTMRGGTGDDIYYADSPGDLIFETAGQGLDRVAASTSLSLRIDDEIEVLDAVNLTSTDAMNLAGTNSANIISGNDGVNQLYGRDGNDVLNGAAGDDFLEGGDGNDSMAGGLGNDTYYVDSAGDAVIELGDEGTDRVAAGASFALLANASIETLEAATPTGTAALDFTGSEIGQTISGNNGANTLSGMGGSDILFGLDGNDFLVGGDGNDSMAGGLGNDTYYVDSASDAVIELADEGTDRVAAGASFALLANASIETLEAATPTGTAALDFTGSEIGQTISGNNGANTLSGMGGSDILFGLDGNDVLAGGSGADTMTGGAGNDTYYVDDSGDTVTEAAGEGGDRVATSISFTLGAGAEVEALDAIDFTSDHAMDLTGNEFDNVINGNHGANRIDGREGNDILTGAFGADLFAFTTALGANNVDRIGDFGAAEDRMLLDHHVFAGLAVGALPQGAFAVGTQAQEADDRIIYDPTTGALFFDADGSGAGAAVQFATLADGLGLTAANFSVI